MYAAVYRTEAPGGYKRRGRLPELRGETDPAAHGPVLPGPATVGEPGVPPE